MRFCCLDQSTKITGYSIWDDGKLINYGTVSAPEDLEPIDRICVMYEKVKALIDEVNPDYVCIEDTQFQKNQNVYKRLSQMQGLVFAILVDKDIGFCIVEPSSWKSYAGIKSRKREEQKKETIEFVKNEYKIKKPTEDEADSIAIGHWAINNLTVK